MLELAQAVIASAAALAAALMFVPGAVIRSGASGSGAVAPCPTAGRPRDDVPAAGRGPRVESTGRRPGWRDFARGRRHDDAPPAVEAIVQPATPIGLGVQWRRVAAVVERATQSAQLVREAQASARAHLEMAEYAIDRLLEEVATVLPTSPAMPARPRLVVAVGVARPASARFDLAA